jgi:hypothetical protein
VRPPKGESVRQYETDFIKKLFFWAQWRVSSLLYIVCVSKVCPAK